MGDAYLDCDLQISVVTVNESGRKAASVHMQSVVSKIAYTCEAWVLQISVVTSRSRL